MTQHNPHLVSCARDKRDRAARRKTSVCSDACKGTRGCFVGAFAIIRWNAMYWLATWYNL